MSLSLALQRARAYTTLDFAAFQQANSPPDDTRRAGAHALRRWRAAVKRDVESRQSDSCIAQVAATGISCGGAWRSPLAQAAGATCTAKKCH